MGDRITYVGLDVHKEGIVVAVAENGLRGEVREYGRIADPTLVARPRQLRDASTVMRLQPAHQSMINRRHDGRASCLARQSLQQMLERKPRIYLPATCKGGHESGANHTLGTRSSRAARSISDLDGRSSGCGADPPEDAIAVTRPDPAIARPIPRSKGPVIAIPATAAQAKAPQPSRRLVSDDPACPPHPILLLILAGTRIPRTAHVAQENLGPFRDPNP